MHLKIIKKGKSLGERFPELAKEWHPTLNGELTPNDVLPFSQLKVWWYTEDGKEFKSIIRNKTTNYLKQIDNTIIQKPRKGKKDKNSLETKNLKLLYPDIASEWDYKKNNGVRPEDVFAKSGKPYWFKCKNNHSWETRIINRTSNKSGCPYCKMEEKKLINSYPEIAEEFDFNNNKKINLKDLTPSSQVKVYWKCKTCNTTYVDTVYKRTQGYGCPNCNPQKRKAIPYEKSLEYNYPEVAKEWSKKLNGGLTPKDVRPMSGISVYWECSLDRNHPPWMSIIHNRTYNGNGCPACREEKILHKKKINNLLHSVTVFEKI